MSSVSPADSDTDPAAVYVSTHLGHLFYPLAPHIDDVAIEDIAHGLTF